MAVVTLPGVKLSECRRRRAMTQVDLAVAAGLAPATISYLERGKHAPHLSVVRKIAGALGVEPDEIDEFRPVLGLAPSGE